MNFAYNLYKRISRSACYRALLQFSMVMHSRGSHTGIAYHTHLLTIGATLLTFLCQFRLTDNGDARNFQFGAIAQGSVGRKSPSGAQGRSPVRDLDICGMKSPRSWSSLQTLLQILTAETIKVWKICAQITPDYWPACFVVGAKRHFVGT